MNMFFHVPPVGVKGDVSLLEIMLCFGRGLQQMEVMGRDDFCNPYTSKQQTDLKPAPGSQPLLFGPGKDRTWENAAGKGLSKRGSKARTLLKRSQIKRESFSPWDQGRSVRIDDMTGRPPG